MPTERTPKTLCDVLAEGIRDWEKEIERKKRRIQILRERLDKLQSQPNPDLTQIGEIKTDIQELEDGIESHQQTIQHLSDEATFAGC